MKKLILSTLLHYANRNPFPYKDEFYFIKEKILKKHGKMGGVDIQHIKRECYSCDGTGTFKCSWKPPEACWSCLGDGVYYQFWSILQRYKFGKYIFHVPDGRLAKKPDIKTKVIEGVIHHKPPKYYLGRECLMWLFLLYNRDAFWRMFGKAGFLGKKRTPLVILSNAYYNLKNKKKKIMYHNLPKPQEQDNLPF